MSVTLKKVTSKKELRIFVRFPFDLYKNHKYWIPTLIKDDLQTLSPASNPSMAHCDWVYYLAYKKGRVVGRIAGIINRKFVSGKGKADARYCWFDFIDDYEVSDKLMSAVEDWARSEGMERIIGPMGFTTFEKQGTLIEGFDNLPTFSSAYNYEYYQHHLEKKGFEKDIDYVEYVVKIPEEIPPKVNKVKNIILNRYQLKTLRGKSKKELLPYANDVFHILNAAYEPLYGFVELDDLQIKHFVKKYLSFVDSDFIVVVLNKDDKLIGFCLSVPNLSRALQKARGRIFPFGIFHIQKAMKNPEKLDLLLIGVHPDYQNKGVNALIMADLQEVCIEKGIKYAETNGEMEENEKIQSFWKHYDARQYKRNRIYCKSLN